MAQFVLYGTSVSNPALPSASYLATSSGGTEVSVIPTHTGTGQPWLEMTSMSTVTVAELASLPGPSGNGWVYKPGEGIFDAGTWTVAANVSTSFSGAGRTMTIRFYRYTGIYLAIGSLGPVTSTANAKTLYNFSSALPTATFGPNDLLYVDMWWNDAGGSGDGQTLYLSNSAVIGVTNDMQITTANFTLLAAGPYSPMQTIYTGRGIESTLVNNVALRYIGRGIASTLVARYIPRGLLGTLVTPLPVQLALPTTTLAGVGTLSATFSLATALTTTLPGIGTLAGPLSLSTALTTTIPGVGTLTGTITESTALTATFPGVGTLSEAFSLSTALSDTIPGVGTLTGTFSLATALSCTIVGVGTLSGTLSISGAISLVVTMAGVGQLSGNLMLGVLVFSYITVQAARGNIMAQSANGALTAQGLRGNITAQGARGTITVQGDRDTITEQGV